MASLQSLRPLEGAQKTVGVDNSASAYAARGCLASPWRLQHPPSSWPPYTSARLFNFRRLQYFRRRQGRLLEARGATAAAIAIGCICHGALFAAVDGYGGEVRLCARMPQPTHCKVGNWVFCINNSCKLGGGGGVAMNIWQRLPVTMAPRIRVPAREGEWFQPRLTVRADVQFGRSQRIQRPAFFSGAENPSAPRTPLALLSRLRRTKNNDISASKSLLQRSWQPFLRRGRR